jgi:hypothetical protein
MNSVLKINFVDANKRPTLIQAVDNEDLEIIPLLLSRPDVDVNCQENEW